MLSRGIALKLLHSRLFNRRQLYCNANWPERLGINHKKVNALVQNDGYQLIFRNNSTGKRPDPLPVQSSENAIDNKMKPKEELILKQGSETTPKTIEKTTANDGLGAVLPTDTNPSVQPLLSSKTIEIKTTKGILSVTTTIEDSKINDVIMEKISASNAALVTPLPVVKLSKAEVLKEAADETKTSESTPPIKKLSESATASVKKVMNVLISPTTQKPDVPVPSTQSTLEAHVLEVKTKKKTINATVQAMEKLAQSTGQSTAAQPNVEMAEVSPVAPKPVSCGRITATV